MAYIEVLEANDLTVEQWDNMLLEEYIGQMWWKNVMGESQDAIIVMNEDLGSKAGSAVNIPMRGLLQGGKVVGNATGIGNEGTVPLFNYRIVVDNVRHLVRVEDIPMTQQRTAFNVLSAAKDALNEKNSLDLDETITSALSDVATGRVRGRYLYGATDSNWDATHATALANIDNTDDQLSLEMIKAAKRKARSTTGSNAAEAKIRPMRVKNGKNYEEWFMFVGQDLAMRDLEKNDAMFQNAHLLIPPQNNSSSPLFTGSSFKGSFGGVLLYEYERIQLVSSTIQVAHNLLLGAGAACVAWAQRPKFGEEFSDLKHKVTYETHEIRGIGKVAFNRDTVEDNGVVHVFSAAVAD
jgi:hypothetical protein